MRVYPVSTKEELKRVSTDGASVELDRHVEDVSQGMHFKRAEVLHVVIGNPVWNPGGELNSPPDVNQR